MHIASLEAHTTLTTYNQVLKAKSKTYNKRTCILYIYIYIYIYKTLPSENVYMVPFTLSLVSLNAAVSPEKII